MKRVVLLVLVGVFVMAMSGVALAVDPGASGTPGTEAPWTFIEKTSTTTGYNSGIPTSATASTGVTAQNLFGASVWYYGDSMAPTSKTEGSYLKFDDQTNELYSGQQMTPGMTYNNWSLQSSVVNTFTPGPHGNFSTASNNCKVCHAVHRANGAYKLLRVDNPSDACDYCHIGDHKHSARGAYTDAGTIYPSNGHTIGAGPDIPDSSAWQWVAPTTLTAVNGTTQVINVRKYDSAKNKIFKLVYDGSNLIRTGPVNLTCMSCHQVHRASDLVWKPNTTAYPQGYKLLRLSPSGSVTDKALMESYTAGDSDTYSTMDRIKVVENTLSAATTGNGALNTPTATDTTTSRSIYTAWKGADTPITSAGQLSVWCADCHNLNIGFKEQISSNFGGVSHSDRTHPAPMYDDGGLQSECYSCHLNDIPYGNHDVNDQASPGYGFNMSGNLVGSCINCHLSGPDYEKFIASTPMRPTSSLFPSIIMSATFHSITCVTFAGMAS
ncbi:MAG: hypothetical protein M1335_03585, partial [Chloroflexi bacterium]|nr:hypothetical protein [Chloroflexota bacterium]